MKLIAKKIPCDAIKEIARSQNVNIKGLSGLLRIPYNSVHNYATDKSKPRWDFFAALYDLGVDLNWFISGKGEMYRQDAANINLTANNNKGESTIVQTGINHGQVIAQGGGQQYSSEGRATRLGKFIHSWMDTHDEDDQAWLEKQIERAVPEYKTWRNEHA